MTAHRKRNERIGRLLGHWLSVIVNVAAGYTWAKHGFVAGALVFFGYLLVVFALYGALNFPWRSEA